ncbi:MAG: ATP-binding cassette domain-containing protein, partial [Prochlorothrix sp.]
MGSAAKEYGSQDYGLIVQDVNFQWQPGQPILQSCSFAVPRGQFWMLLGTNGSGKSTLLRLLVQLLSLQSGHIHLDRPVGFVFQNPDHQLVMPTVGA